MPLMLRGVSKINTALCPTADERRMLNAVLVYLASEISSIQNQCHMLHLGKDMLNDGTSSI